MTGLGHSLTSPKLYTERPHGHRVNPQLCLMPRDLSKKCSFLHTPIGAFQPAPCLHHRLLPTEPHWLPRQKPTVSTPWLQADTNHREMRDGPRFNFISNLNLYS